MAAGKFDLTVFLESVLAEAYTQDLLHHGVDSLYKLATLTREQLKERNIRDLYNLLYRAVPKAQRLVRSSDAVVQEELLVSDTNLILEKKYWGLSQCWSAGLKGLGARLIFATRKPVSSLRNPSGPARLPVKGWETHLPVACKHGTWNGME